MEMEVVSGILSWEMPILGEEAFGEGREERRDAVESRRRILDAAGELFSSRGVDEVSMHEIGRAAGVGQGTLYRRFGHKGEVCSALLGESVRRFSERVGERVGREDESVLDQLGWFLGELAEFSEQNAPLLGAIRDSAGGGRRVEMYRNPFYRLLRETVSALLRRAVVRGEARPLDIECVADAVLAPLNIDLYLFQRQEMGMEAARITYTLSRLLIDGLRTRAE